MRGAGQRNDGRREGARARHGADPTESHAATQSSPILNRILTFEEKAEWGEVAQE